MSNLGEHAIVIGGSIAGLIAARVLADHFDQVTILERDHLEDRPALRKSTPQASHAHVLLPGGQQVISRLYPQFLPKLRSHGGAIRARLGSDVAILTPTGKAYSFGGAVREARDLGLSFYYQSRWLLEHCVRQLTLESARVTLQSNCVAQNLIAREGRVHGVNCGDDGGSQPLDADLVVDAGGRGSRAQGWLRQLGFAPPEENAVGVDFAYSSARFVVPGYAEPEQALFVLGPAPDYPNEAFLVPIEDGMRILSLCGRFGDYPPTDEAGFLAFTKSLHPKIHEIISGAERVSAITHHRYPTALRRHYERMPAFPPGFLVLGDALCSFNPIYGQGMSSAALQAEALQHALNEQAERPDPLEGLASNFFTKATAVIETPWLLATSGDFAYPQTTGARPPGLEENARYMAAVEALSANDVELETLVWEIFSLAKPLSKLWDEPLHSCVRAKINAAH